MGRIPQISDDGQDRGLLTQELKVQRETCCYLIYK